MSSTIARSTQIRNGFSIVELLIVIAIVSLLAGLLIPAVHVAREAARRSVCTNNMRNIGVAILNYEASKHFFPPAATTGTGAPNDGWSENRHSIFVYLLPHFEEAALGRRIDLREEWDAGSNEEITKSVHLGGILICPSAPQVRTEKFFGNVETQHISLNQVSDYAPAWSINPNSVHNPPRVFNGLEIAGLARLVADGSLRTDVRGDPSSAVSRKSRWSGVLQKAATIRMARVRAANIRDGASTTFLFFEVAGRPEHYAAGRPVPIADSLSITSFRWASSSLPITINETCHDHSLMNCQNSDEIYAFHRGGSNVVFADGSTRFMDENIDAEAFVSLYTMAGGDAVSESELGD